MQTNQLSVSDLVENVAKLNVEDFEQFLKTVNARRAQRRSDVLPEREADLLKKIYQSFSKENIERIEQLNAKIWDESLTEPEHTELLQLIEARETWASARMDNLAKLAVLRNTDYATLCRQLGILRQSSDE